MWREREIKRGREGGREGEREGGREGGRKGGMEGEGESKREREIEPGGPAPAELSAAVCQSDEDFLTGRGCY